MLHEIPLVLEYPPACMHGKSNFSVAVAVAVAVAVTVAVAVAVTVAVAVPCALWLCPVPCALCLCLCLSLYLSAAGSTSSGEQDIKCNQTALSVGTRSFTIRHSQSMGTTSEWRTGQMRHLCCSQLSRDFIY